MKGLVGPFVLLLASSISAIGQETCSGDSVLFPGEHRYKKAMIYLDDRDNTLIVATGLAIRNDTLFVLKELTYAVQGGLEARYPLNRVYMIKVSKGDKRNRYALRDAVLGLVAGLILSFDFRCESGRYELYLMYDPAVAMAVIFGLTASGAVIGAWEGSAVHDWETIYIKGHLDPTTK